MSPFFVRTFLSSIRISSSCSKYLEADRHASFILAMNSAFEALRRVRGLPSELRTASNDHPLFHQNDSKGTHNEQESSRKPDVVLVSMHSAHTAVVPDDHAVSFDYAFKTDRNFEWDDILLPVEFKRNKTTMMKPPPE